MKKLLLKIYPMALAYVGLSDSYETLGSIESGRLSPAEVITKAESVALKALEIDRSLAEAHCSLANIRFAFQWDWSGAEREFKQAINLNPSYAIAYHWYSHYLVAMGRLNEALAEEKKAQKLDPFPLVINTQVGMVFYYMRQYDSAIDQYRKTLEMDQYFVQAHLAFGLAFIQKSMLPEAISEFKKAATLSADNPIAVALLGYTYAVSGRSNDALKILGDLKELSQQEYVSSFHIALIYLGLDEKSQFYSWLEKAYQERSNYLVYFKVEPLAGRLHSDPKFKLLLKKMKLKN